MHTRKSPVDKQQNVYNKGGYTPRYFQLKRSPFSSKQQSTKEEVSSRDQVVLPKQSDSLTNVRHAFFKSKNAEPGNKNIHIASSQALIKHSPDRVNKRKGYERQDIKEKKSSEKYQEYFDLKNDNLRGVKQKPKFFKKLSDSGESQLSYNSKNSANSQGNIRFINHNKLIHHKLGEGNLQDKKDKRCFGGDGQKQFKQNLNQFDLVHNIYRRNVAESLQTKQTSDKKWIPEYSNKNHEIGKQPASKLNSGLILFSPSKKVSNQVKQQLNANFRSSISPSNREKQHISPIHFNNKIIQRKTTPRKVKNTIYGSPERSKKKIFGDYKNNSVKNNTLDQDNSISFSKQKSEFFHDSPNSPKHDKMYHNNPKYNAKVENNLRLRSGSKNLPNTITLQSMGFEYPETFTFIILSQIAQHKQTIVYLCMELQTKFIYCLKKCKINQSNLKQLIVESKVGSVCTHQNLVKTFCSFYSKSQLFILMEYMEEGTILNRNQFSNKTQRINSINIRGTLNRNRQITVVGRNHSSRDILKEIFEGILYLHEKNIIHRDIKPENIYMSHGNYKIGDFGSSSYTNQQEYVGTLDYAAPEIMLKEYYTQTIDIWSAGCIAYELDAGKPPFYHADRNETIRRIINVSYDASLVIDLDLKNLISLMLVRNGSKRISAAEALMHPYFQRNTNIPTGRNRI